MKHKNLYILVLLLVGIWTVGFAQNQCAQLNGSTGYIVRANNTSLNPTNVTVEGWVYLSSLTSRPHLIGKGASSLGSYWLVVESTGEVRFYFTVGNLGGVWKFASAGLGTNLVSTGVWHHYAGTYDGTAGKVYVDGVLKGSTSGAGSLKTNDTNPFYVGRSYAILPLNAVQGKIDEVRVWNYARTQTEIADNMHNEISPVPSTMIVYWKFNGNPNDSSANGFNGTDNSGVAYGTSEVTLPVELSSFTAIPTAEYFVRLNWTTQSETGVSGFRIYRGISNELAEASDMNVFIGATNTASTQVYSYVDNELDGDGTYYYWLQNIDLDGDSRYYGPVTATVNQTGGGNTPPVIELQAGIEKIYPNPFNPQTNIRLSVLEDAPVEVVIYNLKGQKVRNLFSAQKTAGFHNLEWNGLDNSGMPCSSGVYTVKVKIGTEVYSRQMVMSK